MKETDCQSMVVDLVRSRGGAATKLSNRFLVGVADLFVKMPGYAGAFIEVKLNHFSKQTVTASPPHHFMLDITALQWKFLQDYHAAGVRAGVLSFIEIGGRGKLGLMATVFSLDKSDNHVRIDHHLPLGDARTRDDALIRILENFCD